MIIVLEKPNLVTIFERYKLEILYLLPLKLNHCPYNQLLKLISFF